MARRVRRGRRHREAIIEKSGLQTSWRMPTHVSRSCKCPAQLCLPDSTLDSILPRAHKESLMTAHSSSNDALSAVRDSTPLSRGRQPYRTNEVRSGRGLAFMDRVAHPDSPCTPQDTTMRTHRDTSSLDWIRTRHYPPMPRTSRPATCCASPCRVTMAWLRAPQRSGPTPCRGQLHCGDIAHRRPCTSYA